MAADKNLEELKRVMQESKALRNHLADSDDLGDQLYYRLCYASPRDMPGWMELYGQVHEYLRGDHPEEKKIRLTQYTEMLAMMKAGNEGDG